MSKIIKLCYWLSIPIFLANLLYVYALLPDKVGVMYDALGAVSYQLAKANFFYSILGLFVLTNTLIFLYQKLKSSSVDLSLDEPEMTIREQLYHWFTGLSLFMNVTYSSSVFFIGMYQSRDIDITDYSFLVYLGPILMIVWIFYFIYLKSSNK